MYSITFVLVLFAVAIFAIEDHWPGPYADHVLGQLVHDTPEVAAAKRYHQAAHMKVLEVLPPLPPDEQIYENSPRVLQTSHHVALPSQPAVNPSYYHQSHADFVPNGPVSYVKSVKSAEEIPLSEFGEVPEVAAARKAHLLAYMQTKAGLPTLKVEETQNFGYVPTPSVNVPAQQYPLDTPEVVAARLEHARAFAAAISRQ